MDYLTKKLTKTINRSLQANNPRSQPQQQQQYQYHLPQQPGLIVAPQSQYGVPPQGQYGQPSIPTATSPFAQQQPAFNHNATLQQIQQAQQQAVESSPYFQQAMQIAHGHNQNAFANFQTQLQQAQQQNQQMNQHLVGQMYPQQQQQQQQQQAWSPNPQHQNTLFELPSSQANGRPQSQYAPSHSTQSSSTPISPLSTHHSQYSGLSSPPPPPPPPRPLSQQYAQYTPSAPTPASQFNASASDHAQQGPPPPIPRRSVPPPFNPQSQSPTQQTHTQTQSPANSTYSEPHLQRPQIPTAHSAPAAPVAESSHPTPPPPPASQRQSTVPANETYHQQQQHQHQHQQPLFEASATPATPVISVSQAPPLQPSQTWPRSAEQQYPTGVPRPSPGPEQQRFSSPPERSPKPQEYSAPLQLSPQPGQHSYDVPPVPSPQVEQQRYTNPPPPSPRPGQGVEQQHYNSPPQQGSEQQRRTSPPQPQLPEHKPEPQRYIPSYIPAPPVENKPAPTVPARTDSYVPSYLESPPAPTLAPSINTQAPPSPYLGATVQSPVSVYSNTSQPFGGFPQHSPQQSIYSGSSHSPIPTPSSTLNSFSLGQATPASIYSHTTAPTTAPSSIYNPTGSMYAGSERWGSVSEATFVGSGTSGGVSKIQKKPRMMPDGPQRVAGMGGPKKMRKILSLDGGGVRGLSTLIILRYIMEQLDEERGFHLEPWQEFDLIGGTSTGGLLAIMLGRLRMSIDECEDAYLQLSRRIFTPARKDVDVAGRVYDFLKANGKFDAKPLEEIVKHLLIERGLSEDELLLDKDEDSCKVFVCAVSGGNDSTVRIRTYKTRDHDPLLRHCKIWEAARATSAASRLFEPIKIGPRGQEFVDGALRHNNPIQIVDLESDELFRGEDRFIISIGTGSAPGSAVTGNLLELMQTLKKIVTDSEEKNQLFQAKNIDAVRTGRMYRFNVFHGLADVGLHEHEFTNLIADHTDAYLRMPDTRMQVMRCVATMKEAGQRLDYIGGEDLDIHLEKLRLGDVGAEICMHCQTGIPFNDKAFYCPDEACMFFMCLACQGQHNMNHHYKHIRFDLIQWQSKMVNVMPESDCKHCNKAVKARFQCQDCDDNLCFACWGNINTQKVYMTAHSTNRPQERRWVTVYPPNWSVKKQVAEICNCMTSPRGCIGHCERCNELTFNVNTFSYHCATCMKDYNASQTICRRCFDEEDQEHKTKHKFQEIWVTYADEKLETVQEEIERAVRCPQCPGKDIPLSYMAFHPHLSVHLVLGPALLEDARKQNIVRCRKVEINKVAARQAGAGVKGMVCDFCVSNLAFDTPYACCLVSDCVAVFCTVCSQTGRHQHRHAIFSCTIKKITMEMPQNLIKYDIFSGRVSDMSGTCDYCGDKWIHGFFMGLECQDCKNHHVCLLNCLANVKKTRKGKTPPGLPHAGCRGREWVLWHPGE